MSEVNETGESTVQPEHEYVVRDRERRRIGQEVETVIQGVGNKIYAEAAKQHSVEGGNIDWSSWSTGGLELQNPIKLSELKGEYPLLAHTLAQPIGEVQQRRDAINDESAVTEVGYWNNPDGHYTAIQLRLKGGSTDPKAERMITLEGGYWLGKSWDMHGWVKDSTRYADQSPEDYRALLGATKEADRLADKVIGGGNFKATLVSHTQRME